MEMMEIACNSMHTALYSYDLDNAGTERIITNTKCNRPESSHHPLGMEQCADDPRFATFDIFLPHEMGKQERVM
jgi:hypothetical protein